MGLAGGRRIRYRALDGAHDELEWEPYQLCSYGSGILEFVPLATYDYDGDGHAELVLQRNEILAAPSITILQFAGGRIQEYGPALDALNAKPFEVRDEDGDGRPDLLTRRPHAQLVAVNHEFSDHEYRGGPATLWHALPDGGFSRTDDAARDFLARRCGDPASTLISDDELGSIATCEPFLNQARTNMTCARLLGRSAEEVVASLRASARRFRCRPDRYSCCEALPGAIDSLAAAASRVDTGVMIAPSSP